MVTDGNLKLKKSQNCQPYNIQMNKRQSITTGAGQNPGGHFMLVIKKMIQLSNKKV